MLKIPDKVHFKGGDAWLLSPDDGLIPPLPIKLAAGEYEVEEYHPYEPAAYVHEPLFTLCVDGAAIDVPAYECVVV